jgi:hypothetical protein
MTTPSGVHRIGSTLRNVSPGVLNVCEECRAEDRSATF